MAKKIKGIQPDKREEDELQKIRNLESIAALSGGIAHDYNNLLTVIIGNISLIQSYIEPDEMIYGLLDEALEASNKAIELKPDFVGAWYNKACVYSLRKNKEKALKYLLRAAKLDIKYKKDAKKDKDFKIWWKILSKWSGIKQSFRDYYQ